MAALAELDLPVLDYADPELRGAGFHERMAELREQGWLAATAQCPGLRASLGRRLASMAIRSTSAANASALKASTRRK